MTDEATSLRTRARIAGLLYLVPTFCGPFSMMFVPSAIVVPGDAEATTAQLIASEALLRAGLLGHVAIVLSEIALTAVLFTLFRRVSLDIAVTATFARLAMTVVQAVNLLPLLAALQRPGDALALFELHASGVHVWEPLFGLHCLALGVLVMRAGWAPKVLGALLVIASFGYSLNGIGHLVAPSGAPVYAVIVGVAALIGEVPFVLWLVFARPRAQ
ncbi:DUF4386 domain-containing protein [Sandaracinus amylolyticus]|uniref:DUF4386 domain-containing protein n=1 Tax=Sandaracinus amylolyticus TaxID=927083 RepID=A0A0F6YIK7_9BACT|nr:DUF4386 domain-containing protein [Sandaracinus amylolyticus]AKF05238.1 Hypothetical protein DB32_002387 [Sandaracinus amylolyticus]